MSELDGFTNSKDIWLSRVLDDGPIMSDEEFERLRKRYDEHNKSIEIEVPDYYTEYPAFAQGPE